ncbi:MAG: zf-HC2 domain-containing protein [Gemmataceae bacterium]
MLFMPSCKEVSRLVSESLDRDLPFWQRFSVRLHLLMCSLCSRFRRQILFLHDAAHAFGEASEEGAVLTNARLSPEARARIKQVLEDEGQ